MTAPRLVKLSQAQQRGLLAFDELGLARRSNSTDVGRNLVYWQTIASLCRVGLVAVASGYDTYELTPEGRLMRDALATEPTS